MQWSACSLCAGRSGRAFCVRLLPLACWDCGFESCRRRGCLLCLCCRGRGLCVGMVSRRTECGVCECDREASIMWRPWPSSGYYAMIYIYIYIFWLGYCLASSETVIRSPAETINWLFSNAPSTAVGKTQPPINPLTPNDPYMGRTASLTSKRCILYIYSTNIGTEYFKHGIYSPCFSLQNAVCFIILAYLVPVLFTFYIQVC